MNSEASFNQNIIKKIEDFDNLREKIIRALEDNRPINILIMETEEELFERRIRNLYIALDEMQSFHNKHYKEFEEKHIRNYIQKICGYVKSDIWIEFKKRIGI